jgi:hypothetical protein
VDIGAKLQALEARLARMERSARLSHAAIDNTSVEVRDSSGSLRGLIGVQSDGTTAVNVVNGPPPPQPSPPLVASVLGGVTASWDGTFAGGSTVPLDWQRVEVHASTTNGFTPVPGTLRGTIESPQGGTVVVVTDNPVYVRLMARNTSGTASTPSAQAGPLGPTAVVASDVLDGIITTVKLADDAVTAAKVAANAIDSAAIQDAAVNAQKIGAAAVTTGKLASGAVTLNALTAFLADTTTQRYVDAMGDSTAWSVLTQATSATWTFLTGVTDAPTGKTVAQATGYAVVRGTVQVPYDPDVLYRVSVRARTTAASSAGSDTLYLGILGVAADGTTLVNRTGANSFSTQHYICASAASQPTASGWVTYTGYVRGRAATGGSGSATPTTDPRSPGIVHADVRFISPLAYLNFASGSSGANSGTGTMQVDAVTIEALKTGVVDTTNLIAGSVTTAALAADSVTATQIAANAVTASELNAGAVTTAKLAAGAVTANEIAANTITAGNLAANSVTATQIAANAVQAGAIAADAVTAGTIAANAVTAREINTLAVTSDKIAANAITAGKIAAGAVDATAIAADAITGKTINGGTITGTTINGSTINGGSLNTTGSGSNVQILTSGSNGIVRFPSQSPAENGAGHLVSTRVNAGAANEYLVLDLNGPQCKSPADKWIQLQLNSQNADATSSPNIQVMSYSPAQTNLLSVDPTLFRVKIAAQFDGDVTLASGHKVIAGAKQFPTYQTGFIGGSAAATRYASLSYRLNAEGNLHIAGAFRSLVARGSGSFTAFILPSGYIPVDLYSTVALHVSNTDAFKAAVRLNVDNTGSVNFTTTSTIAIDDGFYINILVPMT